MLIRRSTTGQATVQSPLASWGSADLPLKFPIKATYAARTVQAGRKNITATQDLKKGFSAVTQAGIGVAGGFLCIVLILLVIFCLRRRHENQRKAQLVPSNSVSTTHDQDYQYQPPHSTQQHPPSVLTGFQSLSVHTPVEMAADLAKSPLRLAPPKHDGSEHTVSALPYDYSTQPIHNGRGRSGIVHQTYYHPTQKGIMTRMPNDVHSGGTATWAELSAHRLSRGLTDDTSNPSARMRDLDE